MRYPIHVVGAGPAGAASAIAALAHDAPVRIFEKSNFPRHKVCGEFLSPEIEPALEALKLNEGFRALGPSTIRRAKLHFGYHEKHWTLADPAFGLSRYTLDSFLLNAAKARGSEIVHQNFRSTGQTEILAYGRKLAAPKGSRIFGFKAHFAGPVDDAVELFFSNRRAYAGVSTVEQGITNVCGLAPESVLAEFAFDIDRFIASWPAVSTRLTPLTRTMDWLTTGPLLFGFREAPERENQYPTGDALGFVDPFTGSGILSGILTGTLAGRAAVSEMPSTAYLRECRKLLRRQYWFSGIARYAIFSGLADELARWMPGKLLFALTRPSISMRG